MDNNPETENAAQSETYEFFQGVYRDLPRVAGSIAERKGKGCAYPGCEEDEFRIDGYCTHEHRDDHERMWEINEAFLAGSRLGCGEDGDLARGSVEFAEAVLHIAKSAFSHGRQCNRAESSHILEAAGALVDELKREMNLVVRLHGVGVVSEPLARLWSSEAGSRLRELVQNQEDGG